MKGAKIFDRFLLYLTAFLTFPLIPLTFGFAFPAWVILVSEWDLETERLANPVNGEGITE